MGNNQPRAGSQGAIGTQRLRGCGWSSRAIAPRAGLRSTWGRGSSGPAGLGLRHLCPAPATTEMDSSGNSAAQLIPLIFQVPVPRVCPSCNLLPSPLWPLLSDPGPNALALRQSAWAAVTKTPDGWPSTRQTHFLTALEARNLRSSCWPVWSLLRPLPLACRRPPSCWALRCLFSVCANLLFQDTSQTGPGPTCTAPFYLRDQV